MVLVKRSYSNRGVVNLFGSLVKVLQSFRTLSIYNNNYNKTGDLTPDVPIRGGNISHPAVAAGYDSGNSYGFVTGYQHGTPNDVLFIQTIICTGSGSNPCNFPTIYNFALDNKSWQMSGELAAVAYGDTVYIAFTADNTDTTGTADEVFLATYDYGSDAQTLTQITHDGSEKSQPAITLTTNLTSPLPVIAWFYDVTTSDEDVMQMYDAFHGYITTLDTHAKRGFGVELANGNYVNVAGAWIGNRPPKSGDAKADYYVARMSYNDYPVFLPITIKP